MKIKRQLCFASKNQGFIIDVLDPKTGLTLICGKTIEQCREKYSDAEEMFVDDFCKWKAEQQRTPIQWVLITEKKFNEMLCILPPAMMFDCSFLVGEPTDFDAGNGSPRFIALRQCGNVYESTTRPLTQSEFIKEMGKS